MLESVLFDFDGTLADTAPDLVGALNRLRDESGMPAAPFPALRRYASQGVRGLLREGMGITPGHADYERLFNRFLEHYAAHICEATTLFPGMSALLETIENGGMTWGIVTNKRLRYTMPLIEALGLRGRAATIVCGDSTGATKPSPIPVLAACLEARCFPRKALFVGDDRRDIIAGRDAGTRTVAVGYGYEGDGGPPQTWGADAFVPDVSSLTRLVQDPAALSGRNKVFS